jgi:sulfur transfer complex TusBCD TusB component (DsrH family)
VRSLCSGYSLTLLNRSITPASDGVFSRWTLDSGPGRLSTIRVFSAQNRQSALARQIDYLASFQHGPAACLANQPDLGAAGLTSHDGEMVMFVHRNVFVLVRSGAGHALALARELYRAVDAAPPRHRRTVFTHEAFRLYPGTVTTLQTAATMRHSLTGNAVRLIARRPGELAIRAQQWGISRLRLANIDDATLEMQLHQVRIEVLP